MKPLIALLVMCLFVQPGLRPRRFQYVSDAVKEEKTIYARAAGEVTKVDLRDNQVFGWDELAVSINPSSKRASPSSAEPTRISLVQFLKSWSSPEISSRKAIHF